MTEIEFYKRVMARADDDMLSGGPVTGAHHRALQAEIKAIIGEAAFEAMEIERQGKYNLQMLNHFRILGILPSVPANQQSLSAEGGDAARLRAEADELYRHD